MNSSSSSSPSSTPTSSSTTSIDSSEAFSETTMENSLKVSSKDNKPSYFLNYQHPLIQETLHRILPTKDGLSLNSQVQALFQFVRDEIKYRVTFEISTREFLRASNTLQRKYGHCVAKAILLGSLTRAIGVPTKMHFVDLANHRLSENWKEKFGEKLLWHGYIEVFLSNQWIALNPAYDKELCIKHGYDIIEFDGKHDALFSKLDKQGNPFMDYVKDHGVYSRVPFWRMSTTWLAYYGQFFVKNWKRKSQKS
ncbi:MAG: transglutaminase-like domain-containing protein [Promethearchaeota archaeon]